LEKREHVAHWVKDAEGDRPVMQHLYDAGDYHYALFFGHLMIEKLIKAFVVSVPDNPNTPPFSHDLLFLSMKAGIKASDEQKRLLALVTTFNIEARYGDQRSNFRLTCTKDYCTKRIAEIEGLRTWLLSLLQA